MNGHRTRYDSPNGCGDAVMVHYTGLNFHVVAQLGDLVLLKSEFDKTGSKPISVRGEGFHERAERIEKVCDGRFIFVSQNDRVAYSPA